MEEYLPNLLLDHSLNEMAQLEEENGSIPKNRLDTSVDERRAVVVKIIRRRLVKRQRMRKGIQLHGNMEGRRAGICLQTTRTRPFNCLEKRVENLERLVPNGNRVVGLEDLFVETADYIEGLEMTVKVMQHMVRLFNES